MSSTLGLNPWPWLLTLTLDFDPWLLTMTLDLDSWPCLLTLSLDLNSWPWLLTLTLDLDSRPCLLTLTFNLDSGLLTLTLDLVSWPWLLTLTLDHNSWPHQKWTIGSNLEPDRSGPLKLWRLRSALEILEMELCGSDRLLETSRWSFGSDRLRLYWSCSIPWSLLHPVLGQNMTLKHL